MPKWIVFLLLSVSTIQFTNLTADTTHNAGEIFSNVNDFGASTTIIWPYQSDPNAVNQLYTIDGMESIIGFGGSATFTYQVDPSETPTFVEPASNSTEETTVFNLATISNSNFSIKTKVKTFDSSYGLLTNAIEYEYLITNDSDQTISEFYAGNYYDFENGGNSAGDSFGYDESRDLLYQFNETNEFYIGVRVVSGQTHSAHARPWIPVSSNPFMVSYAAISDGVVDQVNSSITQDLVITISQEFTNFEPNQTVKFVVAVFLGSTLEDIQNASDISFSRNTGTANIPNGGLGTFVPTRSDAPGILGFSDGSSGGGCLLKNL